MHKPVCKPLSKIPKSSSVPKSSGTEHRQTSPTVGKLVSKRFVGQLKSEIENVKPMPTIQEESANELDKPNEGNRLDGEPPKSPPGRSEAGKLDGKSDRRSVDNRSKVKVGKEEADCKTLEAKRTAKTTNDKKPASSIPYLSGKSRESKLINLSKLKSEESAEQPPSRSQLHSQTLSSMKRQTSSLNKPKQFAKQPATKKEGSLSSQNSSLSGRSAREGMPNSLNLERVKDKIETPAKDDAEKNTNDSRLTGSTNKSARNESSARVSSLLLTKVEESKTNLRNRFESESIKSNQINQDDPEQADESGESERPVANEQHICRICLDSIQVDGDDLIGAERCCSSNDVSSGGLTSVTDHWTNEAAGATIQPIRRQSNYISPCDCKGQSKYVHRKCLSEWIYVSKKTSCQVCLVKFRNIKIKVFKKSVMKWLADEYDHLLMLILYFIPFLIDCILIFNFLSYDMKLSHQAAGSKTQLVNLSEPLAGLGANLPSSDQNSLDDELDQLEGQLTVARYESDGGSSAESIGFEPGSNAADQFTDPETDEQMKPSVWNVFSSFISFKRTKALSKSMSMSMFIYNLYFLELKIFVKNFSICLSGIPVTFLISLPSLLLFVRYCRSRYQEWQTENLEVSIDS